MKNRKIYILFMVVCTAFGSTFLSISLGLRAGASPLFFAALRFTLAGGLMLAGLGLSGRLAFGNIRRLFGRALLFSLLNTVGTFGCMFIAQTRVDSGFMARLDAAGPIFTALLAAVLLRKKLTLYHGAAFFLGTLGCTLIAGPAVGGKALYLAIAAASVLFYAGANILYPILFSEKDDPVLISALQAFSGGLVLLVAAVWAEPVRFPPAAVWPLAYLVLGGSIIGHTAALVLIRDAGPVFASGWLYVAPGVATVLGALILDEPVTLAGVLGTALALAGVLTLNRAERGADAPVPCTDGSRCCESAND